MDKLARRTAIYMYLERITELLDDSAKDIPVFLCFSCSLEKEESIGV